jgi:hypothetical protein
MQMAAVRGQAPGAGPFSGTRRIRNLQLTHKGRKTNQNPSDQGSGPGTMIRGDELTWTS